MRRTAGRRTYCTRLFSFNEGSPYLAFGAHRPNSCASCWILGSTPIALVSDRVDAGLQDAGTEDVPKHSSVKVGVSQYGQRNHRS